MSDFVANTMKGVLRSLDKRSQYVAGKITVILRKVNVGAEQPVYVRYNYKSKGDKVAADYFIPTGYTVLPEQFKAGRVVNTPLAADANKAVAAIIESLDLALNLLANRGEEPTQGGGERAIPDRQ